MNPVLMSGELVHLSQGRKLANYIYIYIIRNQTGD